MSKKQFYLCVTSAIIGLIIWKGVLLSGKTGSDYDKTIYLPALCLASCILGFIEPRKFYLWGISIQILQIAVHIAEHFIWRSDHTFGWVFGVLGFIFFMLFTVLSSFIGAKARTYIQSKLMPSKQSKM